eukprot:471600_1
MPTIRVVVRFRPINSREKQTALDNKWSGKQICPLYVDEKHLLSFDGDDVSEDDKIGKQVRCAPPKVQIAHQPKFAFDEILIWVNQNTAFMRIGLPVVNDALSGVNGTIFAYGQTGSGKTFSMFGPEPLTAENAKLLGIIPRCCAEVFSALDRDTTIKAYRIDVSFFEIYIHNQIRDLLHPAKKGDPPLKVRDGLKGVFIEHLKSETATNLQEILSLIALANSHRTVSSTKMNATSSRAHSVMRVGIRIERRDGSRVKSQINFGDLAGSEKVNKTGATGQTLREAQAINQSLTMLGNVISALAKIGSGKKKAGSMVPFRDSALTHVLKDSLSGNCKTTLVTAASPHKFNLVETISTFRFASRCKLVKTKAEKNVVLSPAQMRKMIESLNVEIKSLKMQLLQGGGGVGSALGGIGVNITWPSDYGAWTTDKKTYGVLRKQVNAQIKEVLQTSVATNSDDVASMPYAISLSPAGSKRKVTIQFHCDDEDEDGDYDRQTCIELSKKLAKQIDKINKKSLSPALKAYKECRAFSEAGVSELKELIEKQKLQITLLGEEVSAAQEEVTDKNEEIENLKQSVGNLGNVSVRNKSEFMSTREHNPTGGVSMVNIPDLFGKKSGNVRASSIFEGSAVATNSLRVTDLLSQLLHSKYEVLRSKRSLQLVQVRYASEKKKLSQLRYIISRMQSEFMDLKAKTLVSKAVFTGMTEQIAEDEDVKLTIKRQFSMASSHMNSDETEFIEGALDDILNDDDGKDDVKQVDVVDIPSVAFDDEERLWRGYDKEWIAKWRVDDVCQWLKKIYGGRMRKYIKHFRKQKIDGKRLLDLQMPDYLDLRLLRVDALQILAFTNSIIDPLSDEEDDDFDDFFADLDDFDEFFDDDDVDDFFADDDDDGKGGAPLLLQRSTSVWSVEDIGDVEEDEYTVQRGADARFYDDPTLRLTDLLIEQLSLDEVSLVSELPLLNNTECINFSRIKEYYHDYSQVLLLTLYGLLCNQIGLLNCSEWNDLLQKVKRSKKKQEEEEQKSTAFDDHSVVINSFVDVYPIYSQYSDLETGKLTAAGGKCFVSSIRQSAISDDLRDDEDGVEYFAGLRIDEMQEFVNKLPNKLWSLINNPLEIEFVYREIRKKCSQNVTPDRLDRCIAEIGAKFVSPNMVHQSIGEMNLRANPTITLDVWIKKLFIKGDEESLASESVLNELLLLNEALEMKYFKQQRLELLARDSAASDSADMFYNSDAAEERDDYNDAEERDVSWVPAYLDLNKLLHDVGRFGTCGTCSSQFSAVPNSKFVASSVLKQKGSSARRCRLNSKYGWTANDKLQDAIHWIQVDLGKVTTCFAVAIQGGCNGFITKAVLTCANKYNEKDGGDWKKVQLTGDTNGKVRANDTQTVQVYMLSRWIKTRYIRLNIYTFHNAPSVRWDVLFGDVKIDNTSLM